MEITIDSKEVEANLEKFATEFPRLIEQGLEQSCLIVENAAKSKCPVDSGQLRNSISHQVDGTKGTIGTNVEYAPYVEVGTGICSTQGGGRQTPWTYKSADGKWHTTTGQQAQPFMKPAVEGNMNSILNCFKGLF